MLLERPRKQNVLEMTFTTVGLSRTLHAAIHIAIKLSSGVLFNTTTSIGFRGQNKGNVKRSETQLCYERLRSAVNAQSHQTLVELTTMQITSMHKRIHKLHHNVRKQKQMNREETVKRHFQTTHRNH